MITIKNPEEIKIMRQGGQKLAEVMAEVQSLVKPGITTLELDQAAQRAIKKKGGTPSFLGYQEFPKTLCTSINSQVVHGIPSQDVKAKDGDILSLDCGLKYQGFHTDMAKTMLIGQVSPEAKKLVAATKEALKLFVKMVRPGILLGDIGFAVQTLVESRGFNVVRDLVGHGIGRELHEEPKIQNYGVKGTGVELKAGMTLAFEPMVTAGDYHLKTWDDGWTVETVDKSLSAHFEHTILVTENGAKVLTQL